jgi:hypothetical protein
VHGAGCTNTALNPRLHALCSALEFSATLAALPKEAAHKGEQINEGKEDSRTCGCERAGACGVRRV